MKTTKTRRTTFRMKEADYNRICSDAAACGMGLSSYIRERVAQNVDILFYDPSMIVTLREYREEIRSLVREVESVRRRIDRDNYVQLDELKMIQSLMKSIFQKMGLIEAEIDRYRKELMMNGNHKAAEG